MHSYALGIVCRIKPFFIARWTPHHLIVDCLSHLQSRNLLLCTLVDKGTMNTCHRSICTARYSLYLAICYDMMGTRSSHLHLRLHQSFTMSLCPTFPLTRWAALCARRQFQSANRATFHWCKLSMTLRLTSRTSAHRATICFMRIRLCVVMLIIDPNHHFTPGKTKNDSTPGRGTIIHTSFDISDLFPFASNASMVKHIDWPIVKGIK